ncbi:MAG TPA: hypothetical protein VLR69_14790 [Thermoanaerobaculia bacterium]|nr:hypothetical protein [Thermoanaerobaculia bacterium]
MTSIPSFAEDSRVEIVPFSRQDEGEQVVVGRTDVGTFLALPREAVEVLDDLAAGCTVGEARDLYHQRHGEIPDLEDFLGLMQEKGFVAVAGNLVAVAPTAAASRKYHFENLPEWLPRLFFGRPALCVYGLLIALGTGIVLRRPDLVPGRGALYFQRFHTLKILAVVGLSCVTLFLHEMSHLLAARAVGVKSRLGIGHRLWILVAETDLNDLWSVPRNKRYLPILAGPLTDLVTASLLLCTLDAADRGWIHLPPLAREMTRAVFFSYVLQLSWQLFFFVRTDLYFAVATFFNCKNLLGDTEQFLKNQLARALPSVRPVDQSHIPAAERRVIRAYSAVWLLGRGVAFFLLFTVTLPLTVAYLEKIGGTLRHGFGEDGLAYLDALMMTVLSMTLFGVGMGLWIRSLIRQWKPRALA